MKVIESEGKTLFTFPRERSSRASAETL